MEEGAAYLLASLSLMGNPSVRKTLHEMDVTKFVQLAKEGNPKAANTLTDLAGLGIVPQKKQPMKSSTSQTCTE
jgi:TRAP-type C4-dicarboxylate transport system permease small subunit